jgi:L-aminopeptidase/D-esterase-like protein
MDVRGSASGTRRVDAWYNHVVEEVHAVLLCGSAGLDATTGVMRYLEERGVG